ncbi:MAG: PIN domain nuclease [Bacillati bacterium ANGP1]|uniref:PIN domain nuclease n=1 Tax=Candidatus Segetimicrobium genomatis TaxID=2569760 RepID=A0A537JJS8_9BACT|nr:MAG: PIN domain nuclease [Terrabacteria group bacterium ANGP1]
MTLTDAGPLVALLDRDEPDHAKCTEQLQSLSAPMLTTWPAFTEAMYLVGDGLGWRGQEALWRILRRGDLRLAETGPMDLADASLVAVAEERRLVQIFTLDRDFRIYRLPGRRSFVIVP